MIPQVPKSAIELNNVTRQNKIKQIILSVYTFLYTKKNEVKIKI